MGSYAKLARFCIAARAAVITGSALAVRKCGIYYRSLLALVRMPLSPLVSRRALKHTRILRAEASARIDGDGLGDNGIKGYSVKCSEDDCRAGSLVHHFEFLILQFN